MQLYSYTSSSDDINLPDPTESLSIYNTFNNYEFLGWSVSGSKEYKKHVTIPKGSTGNKYYIARWQGKLINIYFDSNNGSALELKQSRYNSLLGTLPTPIK